MDEPNNNPAPEPQLNTKPLETVTISQRYGSAWLEYTTRIQARHSLTNMYLIICSAIVGYLHTPKFFASAAESAASSASSSDPTLLHYAAFAVPITSILYALFMLMHDAMMGHLSNYMSQCELYNNEDGKIPCYRSDPRWGKRPLYWRGIQNFAMAFMIVLYCCLGLLRIQDDMTVLEILAFVALTIGAVVAISFSYAIRFRHFDHHMAGKNEKHKESP
jgi:hypothetical protein